MLSILTDNWHIWYLGGADSKSGLRLLKFWPQNPFWRKCGPKNCVLDTQRERETERDRERQRETERDRDRDRDRERQRETETERDRERQWETDRDTERVISILVF